jgi:hypothetical protein
VREELLDRLLPVGGRVADVFLLRSVQAREAAVEGGNDLARLVDGQRRLSDVGDPLRIRDFELLRVGDGSTSTIESGASPIVPSTSSWPCPMRTTCPSAAYLLASACTFVTSGQVASIVRKERAAAPARTTGAIPCAEKTTRPPSGTSWTPATKTAPR